MKKLVSIALILLIAEAAVFVSCKKFRSCEGCQEINKPPIAIAGPDQVITLPTDSVSLDGSASNDPDGTIGVWLWKKVSGPASFNVVNFSVSKTVVKTLSVGVYKFELKVTDDRGLSATDTVQIIVDSVTTINHPPIADAGPDQTLMLPVNNTTLNGSNSDDPDNNITDYIWTKVAGPSTFNIASATGIETQISNLVEGAYQFVLKVTDAGGLFSIDTIKVTVNSTPPISASSCEPLNRPIINVQLTPLGYLSEARVSIGSVAAGNKIFFAGGYTGWHASSRVDIYNIITQAWSTAELSIPRFEIAAVASGNKVFFAGGGTLPGLSSRIDIYDVTTESWITAELPHSLESILPSAVGNKVLFAGGHSGQLIVHLYDINANVWSTVNLGPMRHGFAINSTGNKIYLAGGCEMSNDNYPSSTRIDIFDDATGSWTVSALNTPRSFMTSIFKNGKIYWGGGVASYDWSYEGADSIMCQVEIRDVTTQTSPFTNLSIPVYWDFWWKRDALEKGDNVVFMNDPTPYYYEYSWRLDIYNITTNNWSLGVLNPSLTHLPGSVISHNNNIYIAGGWQDTGGNPGSFTNQVWKLEF